MLSMDPDGRPDASEVYRAISIFQAREAPFHNPYCGPCCLLEEPSDGELEAGATAELSTSPAAAHEGSFTATDNPSKHRGNFMLGGINTSSQGHHVAREK